MQPEAIILLAIISAIFCTCMPQLLQKSKERNLIAKSTTASEKAFFYIFSRQIQSNFQTKSQEQ